MHSELQSIEKQSYISLHKAMNAPMICVLNLTSSHFTLRRDNGSPSSHSVSDCNTRSREGGQGALKDTLTGLRMIRSPVAQFKSLSVFDKGNVTLSQHVKPLQGRRSTRCLRILREKVS